MVAIMHQIDLIKDGHRLDEIFESVINKLPDLRMPASFRLADEDDFFNECSTIQLVPQKKQEFFDRTINEVSIERKRLTKSGQEDDNSKMVKVVRAENRGQLDDFSRLLWIPYSVELERKREKCNRLKMARSRYSKCRLKKKAQVKETGYNKLLVETHGAGYPFAEPIPESMRTDKRVDNLRDVVVMESIEWKMLTPMRPLDEKEEEYFDRLVSLQKKRHDEQKKFAQGSTTPEPTFKHIRHRYPMQYNLRSKDVFVPLVSRVPIATFSTRGSHCDATKDVLWDIPKLTVSGEGSSIDSSSNQLRRHYKTLDRRHSTKSKSERRRYEESAANQSENKTKLNENNPVEDLMDERIEEIVGNFMNTSLDVEVEWNES